MLLRVCVSYPLLIGRSSRKRKLVDEVLRRIVIYAAMDSRPGTSYGHAIEELARGSASTENRSAKRYSNAETAGGKELNGPDKILVITFSEGSSGLEKQSRLTSFEDPV